MPTYKHSGLLVEALSTALAQDTDFAYAVVVVNDGCPFPETGRVCREFAVAHPGRLHYLHKRNAGLSAARNSGIAFALDAFPALEAVYFLDSDNRIRPHLLQRMLHALRAAGPEVGWAYPDVDKFGFFEFCDMSGAYSPLEHLFRNVSEAGSMASRRLLDSGARFDEAMRQGSEDWEFWLQGLERGFHGVHVPGTGFGYRRRGESMLTESERDYRPILTHIQKRHPALFAVRAVLRAEAAVGRRYAVYLPDRAIVRCVTDPALGEEDVPLADFVRRVLRAPERPGYGECPGLLAVMDSGLYELLKRHRLLRGALWGSGTSGGPGDPGARRGDGAGDGEWLHAVLVRRARGTAGGRAVSLAGQRGGDGDAAHRGPARPRSAPAGGHPFAGAGPPEALRRGPAEPHPGAARCCATAGRCRCRPVHAA
ncbi:glycosyltransferase family 2 protein [Azospirillum baldaniorum]|uniref:glycosyltransferase family 2 protein n=1 Tax=Azospirillum baldaniorum TaxID=1064539 RepID=UPI0002D78DA5|nr:glycosyltransferase family A protein [Azospirillum baldaniorum]